MIFFLKSFTATAFILTRTTRTTFLSRSVKDKFISRTQSYNNFQIHTVHYNTRTTTESKPLALLSTTTLRMASTTESTTVVAVDETMFQRVKKMKLDDEKNDPLIQESYKKVIGTHSGTFQADEAMGCWLLRQLPQYKYSPIRRTRDLDILKTCDIVLDVGGIYDHEQLRYDHHQRGYNEKYSTKGCTNLSASGLIYRHYGRDVITQHYPNLSLQYVELAYDKLYFTLMQALDAIDTGVEMVPEGVVPLYKDSTGLSARVSRLNIRWNEEQQQSEIADERFLIAMELCGTDFLSVLVNIVESTIPARVYVEQAISSRYETDPSGLIIKFPKGGLPWQGHLYELERQNGLTDPETQMILFVLYTDESGMWRVQAVTIENGKFTNRCSLPEPWQGLRNEELIKVSNIPGCTFVHAAGFIGGNDTYEGALQMAQYTIQHRKQQQGKEEK